MAWRDQLGWSLTEAAEQLGITRRAYIYLEAGETSSGRKLKSIPQLRARLRRTHPAIAARPGALLNGSSFLFIDEKLEVPTSP